MVPKNLDFRFRIGRKSQKNGKSFSRPFCSITAELGHLQTWQGYPRIRLDLRITLMPLKIRIRTELEPENRFCPIVAQPGHLQTSAWYLQIGLDLRIPTVPINPDFHFRIGRKSRKTEKPYPPFLLYYVQTRAPTDMVRVPTDWA